MKGFITATILLLTSLTGYASNGEQLIASLKDVSDVTGASATMDEISKYSGIEIRKCRIKFFNDEVYIAAPNALYLDAISMDQTRFTIPLKNIVYNNKNSSLEAHENRELLKDACGYNKEGDVSQKLYITLKNGTVVKVHMVNSVKCKDSAVNIQRSRVCDLSFTPVEN